MTLPTGCLALVGEGSTRSLCEVRIDPGVVEARSSVGSGDAFLAGLVSARYGGMPAEDCVRFAVACGAESVQHFGAGVLDPAAVARLEGQVAVDELSQQALHAGG